MEGGICRIKDRGLNPGTVIDIGASNGSWSEICLKYFPDSRYFLIEAQNPHEDKLKNFIQRHLKSEYIIAAAGDKNGETYFNNTRLFGGIALREQQANFPKVKMVTLDSEIAKRDLPHPYFLKLDTHGFEVPILNGAQNVLEQTELVIVEAYNFKSGPESLKFQDMIDFMETKGFSVIDMVDLMLRKRDQALWQMDIFFIRSSREEFKSSQYE